jgi:hypothetical protein
MARNKTPLRRTELRPPRQTIAEFARDILMFGTVDRRPTFWDLLSEALLIKVLPDGPQAALEKVRGMRATPQEHAEELADFPSEPKILSAVLSQAEGALDAHIKRVETWIPKRAVEELYRARREHYPSSYE